MSPLTAHKLPLLWLAALATGLLLLLLPRPAHGALEGSPAEPFEISWLDFPGTPDYSRSIDFDCAQPDSSYRLFATFVAPEDVPSFMELAASVYFGIEVGPHQEQPQLPPFWPRARVPGAARDRWPVRPGPGGRRVLGIAQDPLPLTGPSACRQPRSRSSEAGVGR